MLSFPFYNKHSNCLILDKNLRDYIKKSNVDSFNKFAEVHKNTNVSNTNTIAIAHIKKKNSLLTASLMNYRNYSDTFENKQFDDSELEKEDYMYNFCDLSDLSDCDCSHFSSNNNTNNKNNQNNNNTIMKRMYILIGGTIIIGIGSTIFYCKYS